jgi:hypothetical protein
MTEKLLTYALGRSEARRAGRPQVSGRGARTTLRSADSGIVTGTPFQMEWREQEDAELL